MYQPTQIHPTIFAQKCEILRGVADAYAERGEGCEIEMDTAYMVVQVSLSRWVKGHRHVVYVKFDTQSYDYLMVRKAMRVTFDELAKDIRNNQTEAA